MSSPVTASTNKRKVDALGDSGDSGRPAAIARLKDATSVSDPSPTTTPHIPPPVWGRVLDFMPYEEVRSALLVGNIIANEAVKYVRTLNFTKSCQLDGPSVRRFASVEEVNCLCLFGGEYGSAVLCRDTALRIVPLLTTFSKVKRLFVGGLATFPMNTGRNDRFSYSPQSNRDHRELAKTLCHSLLAAFKARLIPPDLDIKGGIINNFVDELELCARSDWNGDDANSKGMCTTCRDVCSYFPLHEIIVNPSFCECAGRIGVVEATSKRKGSREIFQKESGNILPTFLDERYFSIEEEALRRRLTDFGVRSRHHTLSYLTMAGINELDRLIALGFDPRAVSKDFLYETMGIGIDERIFDVFAKSAFDALVTRGFALDEADLIVLDERIEPALKDLPALIRGGGETGR